MEIQIRGNGVTIHNGLREFIERRTAKLDHLIDNVIDAKIELRALHHRGGPDTMAAQITIRSRRDVLRAEERASDPMLAVDQAVAKLERQVRRVHGKRSRRKAAGQATIRADFADSIDANAVHGSDSAENAVNEISFFFPELEIYAR